MVCDRERRGKIRVGLLRGGRESRLLAQYSETVRPTRLPHDNIGDKTSEDRNSGYILLLAKNVGRELVGWVGVCNVDRC